MRVSTGREYSREEGLGDRESNFDRLSVDRGERSRGDADFRGSDRLRLRYRPCPGDDLPCRGGDRDLSCRQRAPAVLFAHYKNH